MLASFAMQESTCNAGATGGNGEAGLMQIAPPNCEAGNKCVPRGLLLRDRADLTQLLGPPIQHLSWGAALPSND